jgi:hypothetical protein
MWGTRIWGLLASQPHRSTRNQWKSSFLETRFPGVSRRGKHESEAKTPRKTHWSTGNQWKSSFLVSRFSRVSRCGKHESGPQTPWKPMVRRKSMENELIRIFLFVLDWDKNWSPISTSDIRCGLERVDIGITRASREWRPEGAPTNDWPLIDETSVSINFFLWTKTTSEVALHAGRDFPHSYWMSVRWERPRSHTWNSTTMAMDT